MARAAVKTSRSSKGRKATSRTAANKTARASSRPAPKKSVSARGRAKQVSRPRQASRAAVKRKPSIRDLVSPQEWQMRVDLACANRAAAHYGWDDLLFAHITGRVPGQTNQYLIQPYYKAFDEVTASSLHKLDEANNHVIPNEEMAHPFAMPYHRAMYKAFPEMNCIIHLHAPACAAVGLQPDGLLPNNQSGLLAGRVGYHSYEGLLFTEAEGERMVRDMRAAGPNCQAFILAGHGCTAMGRTVADAFIVAYNLIRGCDVQLLAMAGGKTLTIPEDWVIKVTRDEDALGITEKYKHFSHMCFDMIKRKMDRVSPGYAE